MVEGRVVELDCSDKAEALVVLSSKIEEALSSEGECMILNKVMQRETQAVTYMGHGIACPHARSGFGDRIICAIGWSRDGIDYGGAGGDKVHLVMLYFIPEKCGNEYLNEMASLARAIRRDSSVGDLKGAEDFSVVERRMRCWFGDMAGTKDDAKDSSVSEHVRSKDLSQLLVPDIAEMLEEGKFGDLRSFLAEQPAAEVEEIIEDITPRQSILLFKLLPRNLAGEVFSLLDYPLQNQLIMNMANDDTKQIISALPPDDRTALFEELPANVTQRLLDLLSEKDRKEALKLLSYPKDSVGRLMTNKYVTVHPEWTVAQSMEQIRKTGSDSETITMVYIVDDKGVLIDDLRLRKIILAEPQTRISELLDGHYALLTSMQDREEAVAMFKKYDLFALPVVDPDGVLLGIVTSDDILDVSEEEATEDFHKTVGVSPLEDDYLDASLLLLYRSRIPWLVTLVFVNLLSGAGLAYFEDLISSCVALVFFLPLLIGSSGNAGSQAATLVIRSMSLGGIKVSDFIKVFARELVVSIGLGLSMSVAVFMLAWWRSGIKIAIVVSISMVIIVTYGSMMGMMLPFIFRKLKVDPAAASGPLVASLADISGVMIYLGIASAMLKRFGG